MELYGQTVSLGKSILATSLVLACVVKADVNSALSDFKVAFNRLKIKVTQSVFTTSGFQNSDKCQVIALL